MAPSKGAERYREMARQSQAKARASHDPNLRQLYEAFAERFLIEADECDSALPAERGEKPRSAH